MPKFVVEREVPGAGKLSPQELKAISRTSCAALNSSLALALVLLNAHESGTGVVYKDANVTVTAFATKHAMES